MYNEELKNRFLSTIEQKVVNKGYISIFNSAEQFEKEWGADLCTKSPSDNIEILQSMVGIKQITRVRYARLLNQYRRWCAEVKIPGARDDLIDTKDVGIGQMAITSVSSPAHLQHYLNMIFPPESLEDVGNTYRCVYWLAYGGLYEEDVANVKANHVNLSTMTVEYNGISVPIYREALPAFNNCVKLTQFRYNHPIFKSISYVDRVDGDELIRGIHGVMSVKAMRVALIRSWKKAVQEGKTNQELTFGRIWLSGVFYRMLDRERIGMRVDFTGIADECITRRDARLGYNSSPKDLKRRKREMTQSLETEYQIWKIAHFH